MARHRVIPVEEVPPDPQLLRELGRAMKALLALVSSAPPGRYDQVDTARAALKRAQPRLDSLEGDDHVRYE